MDNAIFILSHPFVYCLLHHDHVSARRFCGVCVYPSSCPEPASALGWPLGAHKTEGARLEPDQAVDRVVCLVEGDAPDQFLVGQASLEAEPRSLAADISRCFLGLVVGESGW